MIKKIAYEMKTGEKVHQEPEKMERKYIRGLKTGELVHENRRKSTSGS